MVEEANHFNIFILHRYIPKIKKPSKDNLSQLQTHTEAGIVSKDVGVPPVHCYTTTSVGGNNFSFPAND